MAFLKNEDYKWYKTDVTTMTDEAFPLFWLRNACGGEVVEPFEPVGPYEYIYKGVIHRRDGRRDLIAMLLEHVFVVNLDRSPSPVLIPPDVWQFAFQDSGFTFEISAISAVKVVFTSYRKGFVLKVPAGALLLLAQDRFPLARLAAGEVNVLAAAWEPLLYIQDEMYKLQKLSTEETAPIETLASALLVSREKVDQLADMCESLSLLTDEDLASRLLSCFVEEYWKLQISHAPDYETQVPVAEAAAGDAFEWVAFYLRTFPNANSAYFAKDFRWAVLHPGYIDLFVAIRDAWQDPQNRRIQRSYYIGEDFGLNTEYARFAWPAQRSWDSIEASLQRIPFITLPNTVDIGTDPIDIREIPLTLADPQSGLLQEIDLPTEITKFWQDAYGRPLTFLESRQGYALVQDADETGNRVDVMVKISEFPWSVRGYVIGLQTYLDIFMRAGRPVRLFSLSPQGGAAEEGMAGIVGAVNAWLGVHVLKVSNLVAQVLFLRNEEILGVELLLGDPLANVATAAVGPEIFTSDSPLVENTWQYNSQKDAYEHAYSGEGMKLARAVWSGSTEDGKTLGPIYEEIYAAKLEKEHPDLYKAMVQANIDLNGDWREQFETTEEDEDDEWEHEQLSRRRGSEDEEDDDEDNDDFAWWAGHLDLDDDDED